MKKLEIVSVIICSYNSEQTIARTLESVVKQSYLDIELIVADDASNDASVHIAKTMLESGIGHRFRSYTILVNERRVGTVENIRNACLKAKGTWIKPLAADDILYPECIKELQSIAVGSRADIAISGLDLIDENDRMLGDNKFLFHLVPAFMGMSKRWKLSYLSQRNILPAPTLFIKRDVAVFLYGLNKMKLIEDWPFWMDAISADCCIVYINKRLVGYRQHMSQATRTTSAEIAGELKRDLIMFHQRYWQFRMLAMGKCSPIFRRLSQYKDGQEGINPWLTLQHCTLKIMYLFRLIFNRSANCVVINPKRP